MAQGHQPFRLERTPESAVIRGLEKRFVYNVDSMRNSYLDALSLTAQAMGREVDYPFVAGASGHAFRIQLSKGGWCPSSMCSGCGSDTLTPAKKALGVSWEEIVFDDASEDVRAAFPDGQAVSRAEAYRRAAASIERGVPAITLSEEASLIVGHERGGEELLLRPYAWPETGYVTMAEHQEGGQWNVWGIMVVSEAGPPAGRIDSLIASLELAICGWAVPVIGGYRSGRHAWESWSAELLDEATVGQWLSDDDRAAAIALGNAYVLDCIWDARSAAAIYLESFEEELAAAGQDVPWTHFSRAARLYREEAEEVHSGRHLAPYPWEITPDSPWTPELRREQAKLVERAYSLDAAAITELGSALEELTVAS